MTIKVNGVNKMYVENAICIVCFKKFLRNTKKRGRGNPPGVRGKGYKTCSKECSRIYNSDSQGRKRGFYINRITE